MDIENEAHKKNPVYLKIKKIPKKILTNQERGAIMVAERRRGTVESFITKIQQDADDAIRKAME